MAEEQAIPVAPDTQQISAAIVHSDLGGSYYSLSYLVDAAGTQYAAVANELLTNSNITWAEIYIAPAGQPFPATPNYKVMPTNKIDRVAIFNSGHDLMVSLVTHSTDGVHYPPGSPRPICIEQARVNGIFATTPDYVAQRGGEGAVIVPAPEPPQPPDTVDYQRIQDMIDAGNHWVKNQLSYVMSTFIVPQVATAVLAGVPNAIYHPVLDDIWLDMEKIAQGSDNPAGMNAQQLHQAWLQMRSQMGAPK